ncbi:MAG: dTDP-4-amino-4,6-dideoxygalactose transaminase [Ilumatobacter sp.]|jgi:dTDP-4-amino-4,6-dideoxygalactose transaminase
MNRIFLSPPDVGDAERNALLRAFDSGWVAPVGPELDGFEADIAAITSWPGAVALASGTAALHLALLAVGVQPGDEVLTSSFTFVATANAITYCGATPVFIDSERASWNMCPQLLADELAAASERGSLPAAVLVVDLYGQCADYDAIVPICREYGVPIVEDSAEALGATHTGRPAGTLGDVGVFSFNGNKIITTSGGGMLVTPDVEVAERVRHLATQARLAAAHYEHGEVGYNYRLSNLLAALGRAQLSRLDGFIERRRAINARYRALIDGLDGLEFMPIPPWSGWNGWLTCVLFSSTVERDQVMNDLEALDIESRPLWKPMHLQPAFANHRAITNGVSNDLFERGLCLPSGTALSDGQLDRIGAQLRTSLGR